MDKTNVKVSVLMPAYNAERYIRESIDSVLNQTFPDFELVIVDDGSTDDTEDIIKSYDDKRIKYFRKTHGGVANALNYGLKQCNGTYIARFDADDIMFKGRLEYQVSLMDQNQKIDILGCGMQWGNGKKTPEYFTPPKREVTVKDFNNGNVMSHPTVMFRKSSIDKLPFVYEPYYSCEDFKLWLTALDKGLKIWTYPQPVIWYRQHKDQVVSKNINKIFRDTDRVRKTFNFKDGGEITCVIAGRNEGNEVERTLSSIRATANEVKIIFIDDNSNDGVNYKKICERYKAKYVRNSTTLGSAGSKNNGVYMVDTKYFCLFDCHMRLFDDNWDVELLKQLKANPGCLITSCSLPMGNNDYGDYVNENGADRSASMVHGAFINLYEKSWEFTEKWTNKYIENTSSDICEVSCVLGAVYASSVEHWKNIHGLNGLVIYGHEEPFMSLKTWLSGGKCLLMKKWQVGHLYRSRQPFTLPSHSIDANQIANQLFFLGDNTEFKKYQEELKERIGSYSYDKARNMIKFSYILNEREYFFKNVAKITLEEFEKKNSRAKI